jgi:hypothetical protein
MTTEPQLPITMLADAIRDEQAQRELIHRLALEIADDQCVVLIESYAERSHLVADRSIWDVSTVDALEVGEDESVDLVMADLSRAVHYLDLRGRIDRPVPGKPHLVAIRSQA